VAQATALTAAQLFSAAQGIVVPVVLVRVLEPASVGHYKQLFLLAATLQTLFGFGIPASLYYFVPRDGDASQHRRQTHDVVSVRVARHHQIQPLDAEGRELGRDLLLVGTAVDQHVGAARGAYQR
jgi:hypothetical protein